MKLKNGANKLMVWRNQADVTLVLAHGGAEVYRRTLDIDPRATSEEIWAAAAVHLSRIGQLARQAAAQSPVLQPLMVRDADSTDAASCRVLVPFGLKGEYRLEVTSNLYPLPESVRQNRLCQLAEEIASCARIARSRTRPVSAASLHPAA
jgi:hypothetical protein